MVRAIRPLVFLIGCFLCIGAHAEWVRDAEDIMGTNVSVEFWCDKGCDSKAIIKAVMDDMRSVDRDLSPYIETSELYAVNARAASVPVKISPNFFALLEKSLYYSRISGGAFDISFASVGFLYDYRRGIAPSNEQIKEKLPAINYHLIELNKAAQTVRFHNPNLKIDLGGIAKGYAVDRSINILKKRGITSAIVTAGGDSRILGDRHGTPWMIGIRHPRKKNAYAVRLPLENSAISTSGDYERYFMEGEIRIHHIINPKSGKSADQVESVSILAPLAIDSDALSTTVFVLGVKKGLALVNSLPGVDAIIIDGHTKLHFSQGLLQVDEKPK